ncbi:response regulator receiver protein [Marinicauda algicola]|uniref:Response regulator receiver protein n=1 Tax=Marinicauda algicola TaxID=2029849 RepID=A0A4S2GXE7_9PROT|nr:response regulator receiver protein [Marinicauda algicola]TGY87432.1 response regulator receiver protein [Marinicauda algicola]
MAGLDYKRATAVVFDPVHVNLRTTRYALHELGFRDIESIGSLAELRRRLDEKPCHLLIVETAQNEAEVFRLVRAIRSGEVATNPFLAILLTCWARDGGVLKQAIGCGADDVIIRPFSTAFAEERIRTLVKARKPFIVTSDYIGPDRRRDSNRDSGSVKPIEAPNTLKAAVEGDEDEMNRAAAWIREAQQTVEHERLRRLCMRIVVGMEVAVREKQANREPQLDIGDLERSAKELRMRLSRAKAREAGRVAQALTEVVESLKTPDGFTSSNLGLAKELAMGAYAAYAGGDGDSGIPGAGDEIERTVEALRKRMKAQQQNGGGAEGDAELKRAAS